MQYLEAFQPTAQIIDIESNTNGHINPTASFRVISIAVRAGRINDMARRCFQNFIINFTLHHLSRALCVSLLLLTVELKYKATWKYSRKYQIFLMIKTSPLTKYKTLFLEVAFDIMFFSQKSIFTRYCACIRKAVFIMRGIKWFFCPLSAVRSVLVRISFPGGKLL